jgi:hypothetical protein
MTLLWSFRLAEGAGIALPFVSAQARWLVCMKFPFVFLGALLVFTANAYPWGGDGHRAIAEAARTQLSPETRAKVEKILGNDDLAAVAGWLDDVRIARRRHTGPLKDDPEAQEFNARFPANDVWH